MKADVLGVRISPPVLEFKDTHKHVLQRLSLSVKNVSPTGKAIKIYPPQTRVMVFTLFSPVANGVLKCNSCITANTHICVLFACFVPTPVVTKINL